MTVKEVVVIFNMKKSVLPIAVIFFLPIQSLALMAEASPEQDSTDLGEFFKGQPTSNQLYIGMFTYHFTPSSRESRNWNNKLIAMQYNDFFIGTLENSFYNRSWFFGFGRNLSRHQVSDNWELTTGYRLGGVTGYEEGEAPFSDYSPVVPLVELNAQAIGFNHFGIELMLTTSLSVSFFYMF